MPVAEVDSEPVDADDAPEPDEPLLEAPVPLTLPPLLDPLLATLPVVELPVVRLPFVEPPLLEVPFVEPPPAFSPSDELVPHAAAVPARHATNTQSAEHRRPLLITRPYSLMIAITTAVFGVSIKKSDGSHPTTAPEPDSNASRFVRKRTYLS